MPEGFPLDLDAWLPDPQVRTRHRRVAHAPPDELWRAATSVRVDETGALGHIVRWRIPGLPHDITYRALFAEHPFTVLDEGEHWSVSGLVGRIWTLRRDYPKLDGPEAFARWDRSGTARVLFAHWVEPDGDGRSALHSEARVATVGHGATVRLRALWTVVGPFERLIGGEALARAAQLAERAAGSAPS
jgi:hypothetical protein